MRGLTVLSFAALTAVAAPFPFPKARQTPDLKAMQGEWVVTRLSPAKAAPDDKDRVLKVSGDRLTFLVGGEARTSWAVTLDPSKQPRAMDLRRVVGKVGGDELTLLAVYRIEGDTLTFSYGKERPTDLDGKQPGGWLYICKRKR